MHCLSGWYDCSILSHLNFGLLRRCGMLWRSARLPCVTRGQLMLIQHHERLTFPNKASISIPQRTIARSTSTVGLKESLNEGKEDIDAATRSISKNPATSFTKHNALLSQSRSLDNHIKIAGLVRSIRKHKKVAFAHISDGSTYEPMQAMLKPEDAKDIQNGAYVELEGRWKESPGKGQSHELHIDSVLRVGQSDPEESPIQKKSQTVDHLRSYPHLRLRTPLYSLLSRVRSQVISSVHDFYSGSSSLIDEALYVQPPLITSSDCEGAGEVFTVIPKSGSVPQPKGENGKEQHYFRTPKYLTVSSQLHLEAFSAELGDVWTLSPAFRAEESDTARHLSELTMLEAEFRGITELGALTTRTQRLIQHVTRRLLEHPSSRELVAYCSNNEHRPEDNSDCDLPQRWDALEGTSWRTITFADAIVELKEAASRDPSIFKSQPSWENGLQLEHERWLTQHPGGSKPIFVTHYPRDQKPFYMLPSSADTDPEDPRATVACFDLLLPYGACEVVGGSLREYRLENLIMNMRQKGLLSSIKSEEAVRKESSAELPAPSESKGYPYLRDGESLNTLAWYADLRRFGSSPHGGFGLGFDRLLMYLTGVSNVRDIVAFPRTFGRADC